MALPPKDVSPSELFLKLLERPRPADVVDVPGIGRVRFQVLRGEEHDQARFRARAYIASRKLSQEEQQSYTVQQVEGDATARELLAMACTLPEPRGNFDPPMYPRIFAGADDVNKLSADEITCLFGAYLMVQRKFGPYEESFADDYEVNAWVSRLKEGGSALPLGLLSSHQRDDLLMRLAERARCLSQILSSPPEDWPTLLESIPPSWGTGTTSSSEHAANYSRSSEPTVITAEEAMEAVKAINKIGE